MTRFSRWMSLATLSLAVLVAASCTKKAEDTATTTDQTTTSATVTRVTMVDLGRAVGPDARVTEPTSVFNPNDDVYASVVTTGSEPATLRTRWTYQDGQVVDESERAIAPTGDAATEFHVSKPDGLPAGKYKVEIFLDGQPVQALDFEVKPA